MSDIERLMEGAIRGHMERNELSAFVIGAMIELDAGNIGEVERAICRAAAEISGLTPAIAWWIARYLNNAPAIVSEEIASLRHFAELAKEAA